LGANKGGLVSAADVREAWLRARDEANAWAMANKQIQESILAMAHMYRSLSADDRTIVDQLLSDELKSLDESVRFDALSLIGDFNISSALPALRELSDWLESQHSPGAPYERAWVNRVIAVITNSADLS
jgi:endonuclease/exonuclease/phosphatase (EEP) superfamily protein YafD